MIAEPAADASPASLVPYRGAVAAGDERYEPVNTS
jgi:hypothetical protein